MAENPEDARPLPGPGGQSNPMHNYQFNKDELRILKECNNESFFQRSLPLGTAMGIATFYGVKSGHLSPNARWGAFPKVALAVTVGYFMGKFSYQQKCAEKFMQLPNSPIGEMLRKRRRGNITETLEPGFGPSLSLAPFSGNIAPSDSYTDIGPTNSLDIDTERPRQNLDDYRSNMDTQIYEEDMPPMQKHSTSYDELRKRNRDEYQSKRTGTYRQSPEVTDISPPSRRTAPSYNDSNAEQAARINKYGDPIN